MTPSRRRMLPLERRLPLVLTGVLLAILGIALFVTHRALVRGAEQNAKAGLQSAVQVLVENLEAGARTREAQLRTAAASPQVRALLADGAGAPADGSIPVPPAVAPMLGRSARDAMVEVVDAAGQVVARWGMPIPDAMRVQLAELMRPPAGRSPALPWVAPLAVVDSFLYSGAAIRVRGAGGTVLGSVRMLRRGTTQPGLTRVLRGLTGEDVSFYLGNVGASRWISLPNGMVDPTVREFAQPDTLPYIGTRDGVRRVLAVQRLVPGTPWMVVLEEPLASVYARPARTTRRLAVVFVVIALAGAALTWWITRGVTHPIRQLRAAADDIANGRQTSPVHLERTDELGQLAVSFNVMSAQITSSRRELERRIADVERANRAKADFLAMMSHELRTPLNAIAGYTQLLEMGIHGTVTAAQREALLRIASSQRHLLRLIEDVLSFARLDAGRVEFNLAEVAVATSIANVLGMVEPQARAKRITLLSHVPEPELTVYADREKLDQILLNLVANAVKFTPADGNVTIRAQALSQPDERGRELVGIQVSDTGPGVAAAYQDAIFEPFVQGERSLNRPGEGVGLGLAISRDLTVGMGGSLALDSSRDGGATFMVTLLRHAPAEPPDQSYPPAVPGLRRTVPA